MSSQINKVKKHLCEVYGTNQVEVPREAVALFNRLVDEGAEAQNIVIPYVEQELVKIGISPRPCIIPGPRKGLLSTFEKAVSNYNGEIERIPDIGRIRVLLNGPEDVLKLRSWYLGSNPQYDYNPEKPNDPARMGVVVDPHPSNKIVISEFEDYFWEPSSTGRPAIHEELKVRLSGNRAVSFEVQYIMASMLETESITHENYKRSKKIENAAKKAGRSLTEHEQGQIDALRAENVQRYMNDAIENNLLSLRNPRNPDHRRLHIMVQRSPSWSDYSGYDGNPGIAALTH